MMKIRYFYFWIIILLMLLSVPAVPAFATGSPSPLQKALAWTEAGKYEEAIALLSTLALEEEQKGHKRQEAKLRFHLGQALLQSGNQEEASSNFSKAIQLSQAIHSWSTFLAASEALAKLYSAQGQYEKAIELLQTRMTAAEKAGKYQVALLAFNQAETLKQKHYGLEQSQKVRELAERYERAKKEQQITQLNAENHLKDLKIQQSRRTYLIASIAFLLALILLGSLYFFNRTKRLANQKLQEKNILISKSLHEKEFLLREIHHRVKNNLQVVSSLLRLQTKYISDEKALGAIEEGRHRVRSIALIHQNLYQEDNLTGVKAAEYIDKLGEDLFRSFDIDPTKVQLETDIAPLNIDIDTFIPLGLIINELLCIALRNAMVNKKNSVVQVKLQELDNQLVLEVKERKSTVPAESFFSGSTGGELAVKLIKSLAERLSAKIEMPSLPEMAFRLRIKNFKLV